jgi:hypothetical protein
MQAGKNKRARQNAAPVDPVVIPEGVLSDGEGAVHAGVLVTRNGAVVFVIAGGGIGRDYPVTGSPV